MIDDETTARLFRFADGERITPIYRERDGSGFVLLTVFGMVGLLVVFAYACAL
jgi:hypothetical protein